jgi:hypothetical protein
MGGKFMEEEEEEEPVDDAKHIRDASRRERNTLTFLLL